MPLRKRPKWRIGTILLTIFGLIQFVGVVLGKYLGLPWLMPALLLPFIVTLLIYILWVLVHRYIRSEKRDNQIKHVHNKEIS